MLKTEILRVDPASIDLNKIQKAAKILRDGGLVAFPTETVYGLGANALNPRAVGKIFKVKGRPPDNPLIIHIGGKSELERLATNIPQQVELLIENFWPGPLTIVLQKAPIVSQIVNSGLETVAIRMPSNKIALSLIKESQIPIAAPSANISTRPSPTCAEHVINDLKGRIDAIIDGGETNIGVESTVIDLTTTPITLLRPGGVTFEDLQKILGKNNIEKLKYNPQEKIGAVKSPGMKYRHYSPKADVFLVEGRSHKIKLKVQEIATNYKKEGYKVGIITINQKRQYQADIVEFIGSDFKTIAKNIFKTFRKFDDKDIDIIVIEGVKEKKLGLAIMNRLRKAAREIIQV
ncbi:MAG: threonylcarbamoyl-AMP synthase [Candidatus Lokiarchaeota archaeon]|nr:threonylcarbamoyl-AMP synthase [Candidatus Lokiarchaeota archaeon]